MKRIRLIALLLALVLVLAGCGDGASVIDDSAVCADAQAMLESFVNNDVDACKALIGPGVDPAQIDEIFGAIAAEVEDLGSYTMTVTDWKFKKDSEMTMNAYRYLINGEGGNYYLDVTVIEGEPGFAGMNFSQAAEDAMPTEPMGVAHWLVLAVGVLTAVFTLWMIVDCVRRKMKRKWLWILLMLLTMVLQLTIRDGGAFFRFSVGVFLNVTNLTTFTTGGFNLSVAVPLGAVIYFFRRKELTVSETPAVEPAPTGEPIPENPAE